MDRQAVLDLFKELRLEKLPDSNYRIENYIFEDLCSIHDYIVKNPKDFDIINEFLVFLEDIFIEIFCPTRPTLDWERWPNEEDQRIYHGSIDIVDNIKALHELNPLSKVWLKDISTYYLAASDKYKRYNAKRKVTMNKPLGETDSDIRIKITNHISRYKDPNKPKKPTYKSPETMYEYKFQDALYEENRVKNRFFQEMKYNYFTDIKNERSAIMDLKIVDVWKEEFNFEDTETNKDSTTYGLILEPKNDFVGKYNLFKEENNPFVHIFMQNEEGDLDEEIFIPHKARFQGKIIRLDEKKNIIKLKITANDFSKTQKRILSIVLREDSTSYEREKNAITRFANSDETILKRTIIFGETEQQLNTLKPITQWCTPTLTQSQQEAVTNALKSNTIFSFHGPPGTGKTRISCETAIQQLNQNVKSRILITCASKEAVDNILNAFKALLPKELHQLILLIGTEEKNQTNPHSLNYKIKNHPSYDKKIDKIQKDIPALQHSLKTIEENLVESKKEYDIVNIEVTKLENKLLRIEYRGTINEARKGLIVEIEEIRESIMMTPEEKNEALQILMARKDVIDEQIDSHQPELNRTVQKLENDREKRSILVEKIRKREDQLTENREVIKNQVLNKKPLIIFSTNNHSDQLRQHIDEPFDILITDEITQSTEPSSLIPITQVKKIVVAGDYHQLPPTVFLKNKDYDEEIDPVQAKERVKSYQTLTLSLFERLAKKGLKSNPHYYKFLETQFRMNPTIVPFLNQTIYSEEQLISDPSVNKHQIHKGIFGSPLVFINHNQKEQIKHTSVEFSPSKIEFTNPKEIRIIDDLLTKLLQSGVKKSDIAVISPYQAQVRALDNALLEKHGIISKTVDNFQGQQKNIIILSLVRSNDKINEDGDEKKPTERIGFLVDERRFCVSISRHKYKLIVIGNEDTLSLSNDYHQQYWDIYDEKDKKIYYRQFIKFIKENGRFISTRKELDELLAKPVTIQIPEETKDKNISKEFQAQLVKKVNKKFF